MYGTHAELAARGVDTNALLGLLQEGEEGREGTGKDKCKWEIHKYVSLMYMYMYLNRCVDLFEITTVMCISCLDRL